MRTKLPLGVRFLLGLVSFLLCICLFVTTLAAILVLDVRVMTGEQQLQNLISDVLFSPVAQPRALAAGGVGTAGAAVRPVTEKLAARRLAEANAGESLNQQLLQWAYETLGELFGEDLPISYAQVEDFFEKSTLKEFISGKLASLINDIYNGTSTTTITEEEIRNQLTANKALIAASFSVELTDELIDQIMEAVVSSGVMDYLNAENLSALLGGAEGDLLPEELIGGGVGSSSSAANLETIGTIIGNIMNGTQEVGVSTILTLVRGLTSTTVLAGVLGVAVILIGLLFLVNLRQVHVALVDSGVTILLAGGLMLIPVFLSGMLSSIPDLGAVATVLQKLLGMTAIVSGGAAGLGVAMIVGGVVISVLSGKKARAAEA